MRNISAVQIKKLYGCATHAGLVQNNSKDDAFHLLIERETGKTSVKDLTDHEYYLLLNKIHAQSKSVDISKQTPAGMITTKQRKKAWALMCRLIEISGGEKNAGKRMRGVIEKVCKMKTTTKDPFRWVTHKQATKIINSLNRYIKNEEKKNGAT